MDTVVIERTPLERTATSAAGIVIAIFILLTQSHILAKDFDIGNCTGFSQSLSYIREEQIKREENFNIAVNRKYHGNQITDVEKGIKHIKMLRYYNNRPVRINVVELSQDINNELLIEPAIASENNTLASRSKISNIAARNNALVAINGGYFKQQTGVPLGTLMINKEMYTGPIYDRVAMGFTEDGYLMDRVKLKASIDTNIGTVKVDNINQPRMLSTYVIVYTPAWGKITPPSPKYGTQIVVEKGKVTKVDSARCEIPENGFVIVGPESKLKEIAKAKKLKFNVKTSPEWENVNHIISGGPYLIRNGEIYIDMTAQKLGSIGGRNPRTAIGYTKDNHLIMITADGREGSSIGLTLTELAYLMKELGCVNAMNLDGGGSTVMYVKGQVVNKPQENGGIPLSHTLTVSQKRFS